MSAIARFPVSRDPTLRELTKSYEKHLVVSAVNLVDGGTAEILRQCLHASSSLSGWRVTALVHDAKVVGVDGINYIERPDIKPSWLRRLWFEYVECRAIAEKLQPDFWLSLHDMTPDLGRTRSKIPQAVYCHNAMIFYRLPIREILFEPVLALFKWAYRWIYGFHISRNQAVIVQQNWIRTEFERRYGCTNVVVAYPGVAAQSGVARVFRGQRFFYPSLPRAFKNFEVLLTAWEILCQDPDWQGELTVTVESAGNRYSRSLIKRFGNLRNVRFVGRLTPADVQHTYTQSDCLVFPSKLETWGLPISEAKTAGLFILAADLPYAHETVGDYQGAEFFDPEDPNRLAVLMRNFAVGTLVPRAPISPQIAPPFAKDWPALFALLLGEQRPPGRPS